jgi:hypothetical protein
MAQARVRRRAESRRIVPGESQERLTGLAGRWTLRRKLESYQPVEPQGTTFGESWRLRTLARPEDIRHRRRSESLNHWCSSGDEGKVEHGYSPLAQADGAKSGVKLEAHRRPSRKMGLQCELKIASRSATEGGTKAQAGVHRRVESRRILPDASQATINRPSRKMDAQAQARGLPTGLAKGTTFGENRTMALVRS